MNTIKPGLGEGKEAEKTILTAIRVYVELQNLQGYAEILPLLKVLRKQLSEIDREWERFIIKKQVSGVTDYEQLAIAMLGRGRGVIEILKRTLGWISTKLRSIFGGLKKGKTLSRKSGRAVSRKDQLKFVGAALTAIGTAGLIAYGIKTGKDIIQHVATTAERATIGISKQFIWIALGLGFLYYITKK